MRHIFCSDHLVWSLLKVATTLLFPLDCTNFKTNQDEDADADDAGREALEHAGVGGCGTRD